MLQDYIFLDIISPSTCRHFGFMAGGRHLNNIKYTDDTVLIAGTNKTVELS